MSKKNKQPKKPVAATRTAARPFVDYDYIHKLSPEEKVFLNKFTNEYYYEDFRKGTALHSETQKAAITTDNNRRRRSIEAKQRHIDPSIDLAYLKPATSPEEAIIAAIDAKSVMKKIEKLRENQPPRKTFTKEIKEF